MVNEKLRKYLFDNEYNSIIFDSPSFDNSIIGISSDDNLIYDYFLMIEELCEDENMSQDEAMDFIDYNTLRSIHYMSDGAIPIIKMNLERDF